VSKQRRRRLEALLRRWILDAWPAEARRYLRLVPNVLDLVRLERQLTDKFGPPIRYQPEADRCPHCPGVTVVYYRHDSLEGAPVLQEGEQLPAPCAVCGRPAEVLALVEDPYFFKRHD
jgi:hypothetical protein